MSTSRDHPRTTSSIYLDKPPPYSPSPDPEPPIYSEDVIAEVKNSTDSKNLDPNEKSDQIVSRFDEEDQQNFDEGQDKYSLSPDKPRNPPIISEIEEELKPGNRSKTVSFI